MLGGCSEAEPRQGDLRWRQEQQLQGAGGGGGLTPWCAAWRRDRSSRQGGGGRANSSQRRAVRVRQPGAPAHTGLGLLYSVTRASWLPQPLQTAPEPRLHGQGSSAYPEPHAAGRRRSLARHLAAWNPNKAGTR